jgi:hypothetical protein
MPRFFFNVFDDLDAIDEEGMELRDVAAAEAFAMKAIRELIKEQVDSGRINLGHRIDIEDEHRRLTKRLPFAAAVAIER